MKLQTQFELWNLYRKLDKQLPEDTEMSVISEKMVKLAQDLNDPIPQDLEEDIFESINSVRAFRDFDYFRFVIDEIFETQIN